MTTHEVREFMRTHPAVFYKVWATAKPEHSEFIEYRWPGITFTGYYIAGPANVLDCGDWLNIEKIEVW